MYKVLITTFGYRETNHGTGCAIHTQTVHFKEEAEAILAAKIVNENAYTNTSLIRSAVCLF